jgi:hypothetical protein
MLRPMLVLLLPRHVLARIDWQLMVLEQNAMQHMRRQQ